MSAEHGSPDVYRSTEPAVVTGLSSIPLRENNAVYINQHSQPEHTPRIPSQDAWLSVINVGMEVGIQKFVCMDSQSQPHTSKVLYSEMYNIKQDLQGNIDGFFFQYTQGFTSDGFGILHPHRVPSRTQKRDEYGRVYQDNSDQSIAYTGNETKRVLKVTYHAETGAVSEAYIAGKDLRYALADKQRLEEYRRTLRELSRHKVEKENTPIDDIEWERMRISAD